jgi:hypothetical protein
MTVALSQLYDGDEVGDDSCSADLDSERMRQEMAEDDFKECAEVGKHIAMGRDVLDRIGRHYDAMVAEKLTAVIDSDTADRKKWVEAFSEGMELLGLPCPQEMVNVVLTDADLWELYVRSDTRSDEDIMAAIRDVARGG